MILKMKMITSFGAWLNCLLGYFVILFLAVGMFGNDLVSGLAYIAIFYGAPLVLYVVVYFVLIALDLRDYLKSGDFESLLWAKNSVKIGLAILPMFFMNDTMVNLLSMLKM